MDDQPGTPPAPPVASPAAPPAAAPPPATPPAPLDFSSLPATRPPALMSFDRKQTRELLEQTIGLPVVLEALEFAIASEPEQDPSGEPLPPSKFRLMYERMLNPSFTPFSIDDARPRSAIDTIMAHCGVKLPEILALVGTRNLGLAIARSGERLARVIDGIGEAAEPRTMPCERCAGEGYLTTAPDPTADLGEDELDRPADLCPKCRGKGEVRLMGDLDAAKLFIGIHGGSVGKGAGAGGGLGGDAKTIINLSASATAKSGDKKDNGADMVIRRVQEIIER